MSETTICDRCGEVADRPFLTLENVNDPSHLEPKDRHLCEDCARTGARAWYGRFYEFEVAAEMLPWQRLVNTTLKDRDKAQLRGKELAETVADISTLDTGLGEIIVSKALKNGDLVGDYNISHGGGDVALPNDSDSTEANES